MRVSKFILLKVLCFCGLVLNGYGQYNRTENKAMAVDGSGTPIIVGHYMNFVDGFGQPIQAQVKNLTANTIFASQSVYDRLGRARLQTLAAPIGASTFGYKADFITNSSGSPYSSADFDGTGTLNNPTPVGNTLSGTLGWYYSSRNTLEPATATTSFPYSRSWSEEGPDSRISKSAGPGNYYRMGSGHEVVSERLDITATELNHYYSLRGHFTSTTTSLNTANGYKIVSTDPDGYQSVSYVDADGKTLASAVLDGGIYKYWSYAYYNDVGQLVATVAPKGVNTGSAAYPNFATIYEYDHRGLLIATDAPDEGRTEYMYATDGKLRFSQSAEQRSRGNNIFSYTHYDYLGRLIEAGEYKGTLLFNSAGLKALLDTDGSIWPIGDVSDWGKVYYDLPQGDFPSDPNHPAQSFTYGAVVASENEHSKTWYSYDEFGRLAFSIQHINELAKNYTLDYTYDFVGNVTQVSYQRDIPGEGFFHHYVYDADQRLSEVYTSVDGVFANAYLHARYIYYLHGPLRRIELAEDLQGIDFTYTAQGALKAINHPDAANDPGDDGTNGFKSDAFGMTMEYYEGDYASRTGDMTSINLDEANVAQKFNGGIRATNYGNKGLGLEHDYEDHLVLDKYEDLTATAQQSITLKPGFDTQSSRFDANIDPLGTYNIPDEPSKMYAYQYDDRQQMSTAIYDETAGFDYSSNQNRVDNLTYDDNGNILSLDRRDDNSQLQNDLNYSYDPGTNQLANIPGYASYTYDEIGRLEAVDYVDGDDLYLTYDAYSNVIEIHSDPTRTTLKLSFKYSDQGYRLMKKNHDLDLETWYVRDGAGNVMSIYYKYQSQIFQGELPIYGGSRIGTAFRNTTHYKYNYELIDHQGNVRAVVSKLKFMETLTMEPELALIEEQEFDHVADTRRQDAMFNHTPDALVNGASHAVWLNGDLGRHVGPAKALKVAAGDVVSMEVYANYVDPDALQNLVTGIGTLIGSAYGFAPDDETLTYLSAIESAVLGPAEVTAAPGAGVPKAYMQYLLFDDNFNYVSTIPVGDTYRMMSSSAMATTDGSGTVISVAHEHLENEITIPEDGYLFVYLVNESLADVNVYFDDFTVMQTGVDIVKTAEYYPFGLVLDSWQKEDYRYGYQGQFAEQDEETGWSSFELRMYDPIIARWTSTDPYGQFYSPYLAMGNAPGMIDPDGGFCPNCFPGALVLKEVVINGTRISANAVAARGA
ncbi:MAG: RHS repeat-associated core domain-containing protein [Bacteroidota bacterium]